MMPAPPPPFHLPMISCCSLALKCKMWQMTGMRRSRSSLSSQTRNDLTTFVRYSAFNRRSWEFSSRSRHNCPSSSQMDSRNTSFCT